MPTAAGNRAKKVQTTDAPPWSSWRTKSLPARAVRFMETYCIPAKGHGFGKPLKLAGFQKRWLEEVFGSDDITSSVLTLPRGQGKTTFAAGIACWALFDEEVAEHFGGQPSIPIVAPHLRQAVSGVLGTVISFAKKCPELGDRALTFSGSGEQRMIVPGNSDGALFVAAADVDNLQGLDPTISIVDEVGFVIPDVWDAMLLAAGKRPRSLTLGLGTRSPGDDPNALDHLVDQLAKHGRIPGFHLVDYSATAGCKIDDRAEWRRANPALDEGFLTERALEEALKLSGETAFRVFRLNQKAGAVVGWLGSKGPKIWDELVRDYEIPEGARIWVGVDVSLRHDATAVVYVAQHPDGGWHAVAKVWTAPKDGTIPFDEVTEYVRALSLTFNIAECSFDPRFFSAQAQELENEGLPMVEVPQSPARMVPLVGEALRAILGGQLTHDDDPLFRAHVLAAKPHFAEGGFSLSKLKSGIHIDAAVALCLALGAAALAEPESANWADSLAIW